MSNLNLGIIGAGNIAMKHLEVISEINRLNVVGITSRTPHKAKRLANKFSSNTRRLSHLHIQL